MTHQFTITEEFLPAENFLKASVNFLDKALGFVNKLAGLIGVLLLMPFAVFLAFCIWITIKFSNRNIEKQIVNFFRSANPEDKRAFMLFHHSIKMRRVAAESLLQNISTTKEYSLLKPLIGQIKHSRNIFNNTEQRLHKIVYPAFYTPLSEDQKNLLKELSKNFSGVWEETDVCHIN